MSLKPFSLFLFLIAIVLLFSGLQLTSIYALDEAKNAEAAREMVVSGDYITPTFNGELRTDKPPLHYYFMAASYKVFGVSPFSARFFSAFFGILTLFTTFLFAYRNFNKKIAVLSVVVLLCSVHFLLQMQMSVPDPYLIFFLTVSLFSFFEIWKTNHRFFYFTYYISIGFGILTKGPIAIALPGFTAFLFLLFQRDFKWKTIKRLNPFLGLLISITIALPWFYFVHDATNGEWTSGFFLEHNIDRFTNEKEGHGGLFFLPFLYVLMGFLPFIAILPRTFLKALNKDFRNPLLVYLCLIVFVIVGFFMISNTKLPNYTVPCYPAIAVLLGWSLSHFKWKRIHFLITSIFLFLLMTAAVIGIKSDNDINHLWFIGLFFLIPLVGVLLAWIKQNLNFYFSAWIIFAFLFFVYLFPKIDAMNPIKQTIDSIKSESTIIGYKKFNPAFVFELKQEIPTFGNIIDLKLFLERNDNVTILSRKRYMNELRQINNLILEEESHDLFESPTTIVLTHNKD